MMFKIGGHFALLFLSRSILEPLNFYYYKKLKIHFDFCFLTLHYLNGFQTFRNTFIFAYISNCLLELTWKQKRKQFN